MRVFPAYIRGVLPFEGDLLHLGGYVLPFRADLLHFPDYLLHFPSQLRQLKQFTTKKNTPRLKILKQVSVYDSTIQLFKIFLQ